MLTEQVLPPQISIIDPISKAVTIIIVSLILNNDIEIARTNNSMTFQSYQLDEVKLFLNTITSPEIDYLTSIWE